ncbi:hypothetical protein [Pseudomonas grandcourensis]|uniref:hypothetical protein n=1 Tax=Pseudomonas grandcourensis TaxID=3136736 RepID=UPI0032646AA0
MHNASAERVSNAFFIIQSLKTNMSACGAELLLLESVRPVESSNFRTRVPNKRFKRCLEMAGDRFMHENGRREMGAPNHLATKNGLTEQGHQALYIVDTTCPCVSATAMAV